MISTSIAQSSQPPAPAAASSPTPAVTPAATHMRPAAGAISSPREVTRPTAENFGLTDAIVHKLTWKSEKMDGYARALLLAALGLRERGTNYFNNDDVPAESQPMDKTTVGTVFGLLLKEGVVKPYRGSIAAAKIWGGMRCSTRENCNGHRNQLYAVNAALARTWLKRHGAEQAGPGVQMDLFDEGFHAKSRRREEDGNNANEVRR